MNKPDTSINALEGYYLNPDKIPAPQGVDYTPEERKAALNMAFLGRVYKDSTPDQISLLKPAKMAEYAKQMGWANPDGMDDATFFQNAQTFFQKKRDERELANQMVGDVFNGLASGKTVDQVFGDGSKYAKQPGYDPRNHDVYKATLESVSQQIGDRAKEFGEAIDAVSAWMNKSKTPKANVDPLFQTMGRVLQSESERDSLASGLMKYSPDDLDFILNFAAAKAGKSEGPSAPEKAIAGAMRTASKGLSSLEDFIMKAAGGNYGIQAAADAPINSIKTKLDAALMGKVDPLSSDSVVGRTFYGFAQNAPKMLAAMSGAGTAALLGSEVEQSINRNIAKGIPPDKAIYMGTFEGGVNTVLNKVSSELITGSVPGFNAAISNAKSALTRTLLTATGEAAGATIITGAGATVEPFSQWAASQFSKDVPQVDWDKWGKDFSSAKWEMGANVLLMTLVGSGVAAFKNESSMRIVKNPDNLRAMGITDDAVIKGIMDAKSINEAVGKFQEAFKDAKTGIAAHKDALAKVNAIALEASDKPKITSAAIEDQDGTIHTGTDHDTIIADTGVFPVRYGFLTTEGKFVDRMDGMKIAQDMGQLKEGYSGDELHSHMLDYAPAAPKVTKSDAGFTVTDPETNASLGTFATPEAAKAAALDFNAKRAGAQILNIAEGIDQSLGVIPGGAKIQRAAEIINELKREVKADIAYDILPKMHKANEAVGQAGVELGSAKMIGKAKSMAARYAVLGDGFANPEANDRLGRFIVQDMLYSKKDEYLAAGDEASAKKVKDVMTEEEFQKLLNDKEFQEIVARHKQYVQKESEMAHEGLGGPMVRKGKYTDVFMNLIPLNKETATGGGRGIAPGEKSLVRGSRNVKKRTGFGEYVTDYAQMADYSLQSNLERYKQVKFYDSLVNAGLATMTKAGDANPDGYEYRNSFPIKYKVGNSNDRIWVRGDIVPEVRAVLGERTVPSAKYLKPIADALNTVQINTGIDGVVHMANILSVVAQAPKGRAFLAELGSKMGVANAADAMTLMWKKAQRIAANDPTLLADIEKIATIGAMRDFSGHTTGLLGAKIAKYDMAARLVMNDLFNNMAEQGMVQDTPAIRREFINQVGNYNERLMSDLHFIARKTGLGPFVVAGSRFNRNALRRLMMDPGVKTSSNAVRAKMMAADIGAVAATLGVAAAINYKVWGSLQPAGSPPGSIVLYIGDDRKPVYVDLMQTNGIRRMMRITGANAIAQGIGEKAPAGDMASHAIADIVGGMIDPYMGPAPKALLALKEGKGMEAMSNVMSLMGAGVKNAKKAKTPEEGAKQFFGGAMKMLGGAIPGAPVKVGEDPKKIQERVRRNIKKSNRK